MYLNKYFCCVYSSMLPIVDLHINKNYFCSPFRCSLCNKFFSFSSLLNKNLRQHFIKETFQCSLRIETFFPTKSLIKRVMMKHIVAKSRGCPTCKSFKLQKCYEPYENT